MKIGYRIIKTGIAVSITTFICRALNLEPALFGAISAVINIQPSVHLTFETAKNQINVHIYGVLVGLVLGYLIGGNPISMGLTAMIIIVLYNKLGLQSGILMGIVTAIFVLSSSSEAFLDHALIRSSVIFIGLAVAMIVNFTLWPPRYNRQFIEQLNRYNDKAVSFFCQAVHDFCRVDDQEVIAPVALRQEVYNLKQEIRRLAGYLAGQVDNWKGAEKLIKYNEALIDKAERIYDLIPNRVERRRKLGAPPISEEFKSMLTILINGCSTIQRVNTKLRTMVCELATAEPEEFDEGYWERLTTAVEDWQQHLTNSYYLHALIEVAVVANEIKWVAQEAKKLVNLNCSIK